VVNISTPNAILDPGVRPWVLSAQMYWYMEKKFSWTCSFRLSKSPPWGPPRTPNRWIFCLWSCTSMQN